jgi:transcriptional regulator with XRE-family HTH domain
MTDINKAKSASNLTAYNCDGMELFFDENRKVRASQSAIARMCGVTEATIRNRCSEPIVKNDPKCDVLYAQTSSTGGGKQSKLHNSRTIKILLKEFNPSLWESIEDFGVDEGLAQMAGVPFQNVIKIPEGYVVPKTSELLAIAAQLAKEDENRQDFLKDKPGLKKMDDLAKSTHDKILAPGKFTIRELAEEYGVSLTRQQSSGLSSMITLAVMTQNLERPTKRKIKNTDGNNYQWYKVNEFSYDVLSVALDCMRHMQII